MIGSIVAKELAAAGYKVVGLERGQPRFTVPDFQGPAIHDELRFDVRKALMQDNTREAVTFRNKTQRDGAADPALGIVPAGHRPRRIARCTGTARPIASSATDFQLRDASRAQRYGANFLDPDLTIQDWGVTYDELEPHYDRFEYLLRHERQGRQHQGRDPARRRSVRIAALARLSDAAAEGALPRRAVPQGGDRASAITRFRSRRRT